jgi:hypothetical protein
MDGIRTVFAGASVAGAAGAGGGAAAAVGLLLDRCWVAVICWLSPSS